MRLYLIRHGDPDYSIDSLTPRGHKEAAALAVYLQAEGVDQLVSSPLGRARATAGYTAERTGLPVTIEEWLRELPRLASPQARHCAWNVDGHLVHTPGFLAAPNDWHDRAWFSHPEMEQTQARIQAASDAWLAGLGYVRESGGCYRVERPNRKRIAVFCHSGLGLTWLSQLLGVPLPVMYTSFFLHPSSVTTLLLDEREPGVATWRCLGLGALPHLHRAGLEPSQAGIIANYS